MGDTGSGTSRQQAPGRCRRLPPPQSRNELPKALSRDIKWRGGRQEMVEASVTTGGRNGSQRVVYVRNGGSKSNPARSAFFIGSVPYHTSEVVCAESAVHSMNERRCEMGRMVAGNGNTTAPCARLSWWYAICWRRERRSR